MKSVQRIVIKNGFAAGFADELRLPLEAAEKRRVSVIEPVSFLPRALFRAIRLIVSDESRAAEWTRRWRCDWRVKIGENVHGPFVDRAAAIRYEKFLIQRSGMVDRYLDAAAGARA